MAIHGGVGEEPARRLDIEAVTLRTSATRIEGLQ